MSIVTLGAVSLLVVGREIVISSTDDLLESLLLDDEL
jgi:hypothetical protein